MNAMLPTVHVTATCDSCGAENRLTINSVHDQQAVACSTCGGHLGTVAELQRKAAAPAARTPRDPNGTAR
jgi:hypothetical protein